MNDSDTIVREDLARVFKWLGLSMIEPNLPTIIKIGGITHKQERIGIYAFSNRFNAWLSKQLQSAEIEKKMIIHKMHSLI